LPKQYVGKLGSKWDFPSDHLPIAAHIESFTVASWDVLNSAFLFWIMKDVQGLANSPALQNPLREDSLVAMCLEILEDPKSPKHLFALQECSPSFLTALQKKLPNHITLLYKSDTPNCLAILYDTTVFTFEDLSFAYPFSSDPEREIIELKLRREESSFCFINVHLPENPASAARFELTRHLAQKNLKGTVLLGDMNFTAWEMEDALARGAEELVRCPLSYPTTIGYDLYAKQVDHIFAHKNLNISPLPPIKSLTFL
jgi:hypothetical protein